MAYPTTSGSQMEQQDHTGLGKNSYMDCVWSTGS